LFPSRTDDETHGQRALSQPSRVQIQGPPPRGAGACLGRVNGYKLIDN